MKIRIITDRKPWVNGKAQDLDAEVETSDADGKAVIDAGFAVAVDKPKSRGKSNADV